MHPTVKPVAPRAAEVATLLTLQRKDSRLLLSLTEKNGKLTLLRELVADPLKFDAGVRQRQLAQHQLMELYVAMLNFQDVYKRLPAGITSKAGKPLLSWRVQLLPYLENNELYQQFHRDEPWDSRHNKQFIKKMPDVFRGPVSKVADEGETVYAEPRGKDTLFPPNKAATLTDVTDDKANTILLVEVDDEHAMIWTKPDDWEFDPQKPALGLGQFPDGFHAMFCEFPPQFVPKDAAPADLRALFTPAGGEPPKLFPPSRRGSD
jgi:hypothetical protein